MSNFDAGSYNLNFGNVGGPNRFSKAPAPSQKPELDKAEDRGPRDGVDLGSLPFLQVSQEILPADPIGEQSIIAGAGSVSRSESVSASPGLLDLNTIGGLDNKFSSLGTGITALNGLNSTSIFSLSGKTIASVNAFSPLTATRMPTTSVGTFGIEDTSFVTSSGRVIGANSPTAVKMPTTSVGTFGLEDTKITTYNGREFSIK